MTHPLQFNLIIDDGACRGSDEGPVIYPTRIVLRGHASNPSAIDLVALADALWSYLLPGHAVDVCTVNAGEGCWALGNPVVDKPAAFNLLVLIADGTDAGSVNDDLVQRYVDAGHDVIGLVPTGADPWALLPPGAREHVALFYDSDPNELVAQIAEIAIGGGEERRVFISYAHTDGQQAAEEVFDVLSHARFDCYLDRFRTPPSSNFVERIEDELIDKAMVVLIESPGAALSTWVLHEIACAQIRGYGVLAVNVDGTFEHPLVLEPDRIRVQSADPDWQLEVLRRVEATHLTSTRFQQRSRVADIHNTLRLHAPSATVVHRPEGADAEVAGITYRIDAYFRPGTVREVRRTSQRADDPSVRPVLCCPVFAGHANQLDQRFLDLETPTAIVPDGLLVRGARLIETGAL